MAVLLLRLCGPMQSWGTQSRFTNRDTGLEPSKSGVIGMLCAARGIPRDDTASLARLANLKMGVRVDREGTMKRDYHTALNVAKAGGGIKDCEPSQRYYLSDACFLVGLSGDLGLLTELASAVKKPVWQLYLGRKSFLPGLPVWLPDGLEPGKSDLEEALSDYPYLCAEKPWDDPERKLRLEIEVPYGQGDRVKQDQPLSFENGRRRFALRHVITRLIARNALPAAVGKEELCTFLA